MYRYQLIGFFFVIVFDISFFFFQAEDGIRDIGVTGVQTCALPISPDWRAISKRRSKARSGSRAALVMCSWLGCIQSSQPDRKSVVLGKECRSRWSPYH